ncbi:MAG: hypothetical protein C0506_06650 [Anaerolinea sp.]|nr:hypothetical protein [Anaerolinea sp.]
MNIELAILTLYALCGFVLGRMWRRWQARQHYRRQQEMVRERRITALRRLSWWEPPSRPKG